VALDPTPRGLQLSDAEYRMFAELLRGHCGLHFGPEARYVLEKRLARRVRELGLASFAAYHYLLRGAGGDGELGQLVDEVATNETYFFRERRQLEALLSEILPEALLTRRARGGGPVAIWSAGCSSGEEPYSIAMLALEAGFVPGQDFRLYASDISRRMLRKAREGVYREASFRETEPRLRERYFTEKDGRFALAEEVRRHVDFIHLNLLDRSKTALLCGMDVILCRNVIIYFNAETKQQVIETLYEKLRPGGLLLLGHAESLINLSTRFELNPLRDDLVYRRPLPGRSLPDPWQLAAQRVTRGCGRGEDA
jgi:chemotaxis protein methyltransferase CheR